MLLAVAAAPSDLTQPLAWGLKTPLGPFKPLLEGCFHMQSTIDITPTWLALLPILIYGLESSDPQVKQYARDELFRMAAIADKAVQLLSPKE